MVVDPSQILRYGRGACEFQRLIFVLNIQKYRILSSRLFSFNIGLMASAGRPRKILGPRYKVPSLFVSREENQGLLDLIAKRFRSTGMEPSKQDLAREAIADLLRREGLLTEQLQPSKQASAHPNKRLQ